MKELDDLSNSELADNLAELDEVIQTDQGIIAAAQRRIRNNSRMRERIIDLIKVQASHKGWRQR